MEQSQYVAIIVGLSLFLIADLMLIVRFAMELKKMSAGKLSRTKDINEESWCELYDESFVSGLEVRIICRKLTRTKNQIPITVQVAADAPKVTYKYDDRDYIFHLQNMYDKEIPASYVDCSAVFRCTASRDGTGKITMLNFSKV